NKHYSAIPHPVLVLNDGTTRQFGPTRICISCEGHFGPDPDPAGAQQYHTVFDGLNDALLIQSWQAVESSFSDDYNAFSNNCIDYNKAVLEEYAQRLLKACKVGDKESCKELKELCESSVAPSQACKDYEKE